MKWREETSAGTRARLHVLRVVDPLAPPVLVLHGLGVAGSIWQGFARRLLPQLAVVAPDLRGHGQSDAPPGGYQPTDYASDLIELADSHQPDRPTDHGTEGPGNRRRVVRPERDAGVREDGRGDSFDDEGWLAAPVLVVGHSLGAMVALALADLRPDLVSGLVLLDPPLDPDLPNPEIASVYRLRHAAAGELEAYLLSRNPGAGQLLAQSLARLFRMASDAVFEAFFTANDRAPGAEAFAQAARIRQPCLVLQADAAHGGLLGDTVARRFVDRLPHGQLLKIPGAAHALHASHPAEVARAILEFYSSEVGSVSR